VVSLPICANKVRNDPAKAILQPAKMTAMCTRHKIICLLTSPISPFLLAQKLLLKQNAPTDNKQPKSDEAKKHHWWLKIKELMETN